MLRSFSIRRIGIAAGVLFSGLSGFAQEAVPPPPIEAAAEIDRVVVTGSYIPIPTAETEGPLPVTNLAREQIRNFGANTPAEGLRRLPSFIGRTENENNSVGGTGAARVNLRAFGSRNTLTLINGRRAFSLEDINALPLGFIDSIEVLKDGASATYGADAVAGVVNFKLRHAMNGGEIDLLYGNTNLGVANDAAVRTGYVVGGLARERYNITAGASYYDRGAILSSDTFLSSLSDRQRLGGSNFSPTEFPGRISRNAAVPNDGTIPLRPAGTFTNVNVPQALADPASIPSSVDDYVFFDPTGQSGGGLDYKKYTPAIPEQERFGFLVDGEYKLLPANQLTFFGTLLYANTRQYNGLEPSHFTLFGDIARSSPFNPVASIPQIDPGTGQQALDPVSGQPVFAQRLNSVGYAGVEAGSRERTYDRDFFHAIAGLRGEFARDYFWEVGYVYDRSELTRTDRGDQRLSLLAPAMANGSFNPFIGADAPRSGTLNGFTYDNAAALRNASYTGHSTGTTEDQSLDGKIGGRVLTNLPQGGVSFVVGFDLRRQDLTNEGDPVLVADDGLSFDADTRYSARQDVAAAYVELNLPFVVSTMNVPLVRSLDLTFAWRTEHFEISGIDPADGVSQVTKNLSTGVPKFALRYAPVPDVILRASYSQSFRVPTLAELFEPRTENSSIFPIINDPLHPGGIPGGPNFVVPPGGTIIGGSIDLEPERTDSYSAGIVLTPKFIPGFTLTADYYQLNSKDVVVTGFAQPAVIRNAASGGQQFSDRVIRDSSGALFQILDFPFNAARKSVEGIEFFGIYELPTESYGKFTFTAAFNHLTRFNVQLVPGAGFTNFLGRFQNAPTPLSPGSVPVNKGYAQVQWDYGGWQWVNTFNYVGDYKDFGADVFGSSLAVDENGQLPDPANIEFTRNRRVKAYLTFDTQLSYTFRAPAAPAASGKGAPSEDPRAADWRRWLDDTTIRVGMNNILDEPPPFVAGAVTGDNYDTSLATLRGRYYYIGLNKKF